MARAGRWSGDEISVDELLRETGATPRVLPGPVREDQAGDGYRERLEQRARDAAAAQQRAGRWIRWAAALVGCLVVLGSLLLVALTSDRSPGRQAALSDPLPLASTSATPTPSRPSPTPVPTVLRQTATSAQSRPRPQPQPQPQPVAPACLVRFTVTDQWNDGFTAGVAVTNTGTRTLVPWTLSWSFTATGQRVTHSWNGDFSQSGTRVTMDAVSYNATLAPGGTVEIGFNGAFDHGNPAPGGFSLNGARCAAG
jgi:hypothetical protein